MRVRTYSHGTKTLDVNVPGYDLNLADNEGKVGIINLQQGAFLEKCALISQVDLAIIDEIAIPPSGAVKLDIWHWGNKVNTFTVPSVDNDCLVVETNGFTKWDLHGPGWKRVIISGPGTQITRF